MNANLARQARFPHVMEIEQKIHSDNFADESFRMSITGTVIKATVHHHEYNCLFQLGFLSLMPLRVYLLLNVVLSFLSDLFIFMICI